MIQKLTAPRALTALVARRAIQFASVIAVIITVVGITISAILVYLFTPWWWLLAALFILVFGVFLLIRIITMTIVRVIHPNKLTREQKQAMNQFVDKIQEIVEAKSMPLFLVALICIKDILFHQDVVTIKKLISNTTGLHKQYSVIEKLF